MGRKANRARRGSLTRPQPAIPSLAMPASASAATAQYRRARALIGFLPEPEAVRLLLGRLPTPGEDTAVTEKEAARKRSNVETRRPYEPSDPEISIDDRSGLEEIARRPEIQASFAPFNWRIAQIDLTRVLAFQPLVSLQNLDARMMGVLEGRESLSEFCLPNDQTPSSAAFSQDSDSRGVAISSPNPNLRIAGSGVANVEVPGPAGSPPLKAVALQTFVTLNCSSVQVVRYSNRSFIRDGYHRAAGLLRAGINNCPCIFIEARSMDEIGRGAGTVPEQVLFGDRPPLLADFWNDEVSSEVAQAVTMKVVRMRGDEFMVPI